MIAVKIFDVSEKIFQVIAKIAVFHLTKKEDKIYRKIDLVNERAKSEIEFAKKIVHHAESNQMRDVFYLSQAKSDIEMAYQDILKRAGV